MMCLCNCKLDIDTSDYYCTKCFTIHKHEMNIVHEKYEKNKNNFIPIWKRDHDRNRFTKYNLEYLHGIYNENINIWTWRFILQEIPEEFTWYEVHQVFRKLNIGDYWLSFGSYIQANAKLNKHIIAKADRFTDLKIGLYRINYFYLLYKFTQLYSENEHDCKWIPLKGKIKWITKMDEWWKTICEQEKFTFIPTRIYRLSWNKLKYLEECNIQIKLKAEGSGLLGPFTKPM